MADEYGWTKQKKYYGEYKNAEEWASQGLFNDENSKTPFVGFMGHTCPHWFDLAVFPKQVYRRPYKSEQVSKEDKGDIITIKRRKKYLHPYDGEVDAILNLSCSPDMMNSESRGQIAFLNGKVKAGLLSNGKNYNPVFNAEDCKKTLDEYLKIDGFGANLINIVNNSNLPEEVKQRCKGIA